MAIQSYFGLDGEDGQSWTLVQRIDGKTVLMQRFRNSIEGLNALADFIRMHCEKPRIYIKSTARSALRLLKYLCGIPDAEVMFVSEAGFRQYQTWLPTARVNSAAGTTPSAEILARCAERMI